MALPEYHQNNFDTLQRAFAFGDAALLECVDKKTGKKVALICAVERPHTNPEEEYVVKPFAVMVDENPFERYEPSISEEEKKTE